MRTSVIISGPEKTKVLKVLMAFGSSKYSPLSNGGFEIHYERLKESIVDFSRVKKEIFKKHGAFERKPRVFRFKTTTVKIVTKK
ncbi:MAG: hypothetical protein ACJARG_000043 [Arcticibacterium sp.]|jgi:hypothetical protein